MTVNNLAMLQRDTNEFSTAEAGFQEALAIYRRLAETDRQVYVPNIATTLVNPGLLKNDQKEFATAKTAYREALAIFRCLTETNPEVYLSDVAKTLNNLANSQKAMNEFAVAKASYEEALAIYRRSAEMNPSTYLPEVAMVAINMSLFYLNSISEREKSLSYANEALIAALPFLELVPRVQGYANVALQVGEAWGLDREAFIEEAAKAWRGVTGKT